MSRRIGRDEAFAGHLLLGTYIVGASGTVSYGTEGDVRVDFWGADCGKSAIWERKSFYRGWGIQ